MTDVCAGGGYGIYNYRCYYSQMNKNTITGWVARGSSYSWWGIRNYYCYNGLECKGNNISNNTTRARSYGIEAYYCYGTQDISDNTISHNKWGQTYSSYTRPGCVGIYTYRGDRVANKINRNLIDSNDMGLYYSHGIFDYYWNGEVSDNTIRYNRIVKTSGSAIGYMYPMYNYYVYNLTL